MTPAEFRLLRAAIITITVVMIAVAFLRWVTGSEVEEGDYYYLSAGLDWHDPTTIPATLPPASPSTVTVTTAAPTTTSTSTTVAAGSWYCPAAVATALEVGWSPAEVVTLDRIVWRESRCQHSVTNLEGRDRSYGLLQINVKGGLWADRATLCQLHRPDDLLDSRTNLSCGLELWRRSGWTPWGGGA